MDDDSLREPAEDDGRIPRSVVGESDPDGPVEPGSPSLEHIAFTLLGAVFTLFALSRLFF
jgi:hypothetical protein